MSIYVDSLFTYPIEATPNKHARHVAKHTGGRWCHLWCDPGEEERLHTFARTLGLKRQWFQNRPGFPHYDLTPSRRTAALIAGAKEVLLSEWLKENSPVLKQLRESSAGPTG